MNLNEVKSALDHVLTHCPEEPVMIWGPPGVGKSQGVKQVMDKHGLTMVDMRLSQMDSPDLRGIPSVVDGQTVFHPPKELPTAPGRGLFLDEINAAPRSMMAAGMQLVHDRALGTWRAPKGMPIWAAGNRACDKAVANRMPSALNNRFLHFTVEPDLDTMLQYAYEQGWPLEIIHFLRMRPELLHNMAAMEKEGEAFPSPRSWEKVVITKAMEVQDPALRRQLLMAAVGKGAMIELENFVKQMSDLPDLNEIILNPSQARVPEDSGVKYALATALAKVADEVNVQAILSYLSRIRERDFAVLFVQSATRKNNQLYRCSPVAQFMASHKMAA